MRSQQAVPLYRLEVSLLQFFEEVSAVWVQAVEQVQERVEPERACAS